MIQVADHAGNMNEQAGTTAPTVDLAKGLPQFTQSAPEALAKEKAEMAALQNKPALTRWKGYWAKTGPAWMQSAMTLGGGSAFASLFAGAYLQYKLLWVQPVAMILGIIMLSAMSHQTLSTGARPFHAMKNFIHPALRRLVDLFGSHSHRDADGCREILSHNGINGFSFILGNRRHPYIKHGNP